MKPPEVCDSYHEHSFLDARDAEGDWRVGYVLERNEKARYFRVRFDGWQAKWDEVISFEIQTYFFSSPKLRHFRTMTLGYTGQKVHAAIRPGWKFDMKRHEEVNPPTHSELPENLQVPAGATTTNISAGCDTAVTGQSLHLHRFSVEHHVRGSRGDRRGYSLPPEPSAAYPTVPHRIGYILRQVLPIAGM